MTFCSFSEYENVNEKTTAKKPRERKNVIDVVPCPQERTLVLWHIKLKGLIWKTLSMGSVIRLEF